MSTHTQGRGQNKEGEKRTFKKEIIAPWATLFLACNFFSMNGSGKLIIQESIHPMSSLVKMRSGMKTHRCLTLCCLAYMYPLSLLWRATAVQDSLVWSCLVWQCLLGMDTTRAISLRDAVWCCLLGCHERQWSRAPLKDPEQWMGQGTSWCLTFLSVLLSGMIF